MSDSVTPWTAACQASLSITNSWSLLRLMSIELVMPSNYLILFSPSPPTLNLSQHQGLFQESILHIRWQKYWSFSFNISPSNEYSGLISFGMNGWDLLAVQGALKTTVQKHQFFSTQLSHPVAWPWVIFLVAALLNAVWLESEHIAASPALD